MRIHEWLAREGRSAASLSREMKAIDPRGEGMCERSIQIAARRSGSLGNLTKAALVVAATGGEVGFIDLLPWRYAKAIRRRVANANPSEHNGESTGAA